jgi:hypothetical protein
MADEETKAEHDGVDDVVAATKTAESQEAESESAGEGGIKEDEVVPLTFPQRVSDNGCFTLSSLLLQYEYRRRLTFLLAFVGTISIIS